MFIKNLMKHIYIWNTKILCAKCFVWGIWCFKY